MKKEKKLLELSSDVVFKAFMTSDNTLEYKVLLLSEITTLPKEFFVNASYTTRELNPDHKLTKTFRTDVFVKAVNNTTLVLEMNNEYYKGVLTKSLEYSFRIMSENIQKSDDYKDAVRHIEINFNNFSIDKSKRLVTKLGITDLDTNEIATDLWTGYIVDIALLNKGCYNQNERLLDLLKIFSNEGIEDIRGGKIMDKDVKKALDDALTELERISSDEKIVGLYDAEKRERMIRKSMIETAKEEGIEQGIEQGTINTKKEIVKNMLNQGIDLETISKCTNLSIEEIEKLK